MAAMGTVKRTAVTAAVVAALLAAAVSEVSARFPVGRTFGGSPEVYSFGVKGPSDVELFRQVVRRRQLPTRFHPDTVKYPPDNAGAGSKSIVTYVEVTVPRRFLLKDEVRIMGGGPGLDHVAVSVGGRRSQDYTVVIYGQDLDSKRLMAKQQAPQAATAAADSADVSADVVQTTETVVTEAAADTASAGGDSSA